MTDFDTYVNLIAENGLDAVLAQANEEIDAQREASILERTEMKAATALAQDTADQALSAASASSQAASGASQAAQTAQARADAAYALAEAAQARADAAYALAESK